MSNESSTPSPDPAKGSAPTPAAAHPAASAPPSPLPPAKISLGRRIKRFFVYWIAGLLLAVGLWTLFSLNWSYSDGDRGGVLQKFSSKGWICKTYEGELAMYVVPGMAPEIWEFSVRDKAVAAQLSGFVGERVQLHYSEHRGLPTSCFGETSYFVDRVTPAPPAVTSEAPPGPAMLPTPPAPP
jgi:hypothetical protein